MLVWNAIPSIALTMSAIFFDEALMASIVSTTAPTTTPPLTAASDALAGAMQLPREPANLGMDLAVIAEAFGVTVVGGLGSITGAFLAALLIRLVKSACVVLGSGDIGFTVIAFPKRTPVAEFVVMAIVLALRPYGLLGRTPATPPPTPIAEFRELVRPPARSFTAR